jgi:hypothetical protein
VPGSDAEKGQILAAARTEKRGGQDETRLLGQPTPTEPSIELKIENHCKVVQGLEFIIHANHEKSLRIANKTKKESAGINQVISKQLELCFFGT